MEVTSVHWLTLAVFGSNWKFLALENRGLSGNNRVHGMQESAAESMDSCLKLLRTLLKSTFMNTWFLWIYGIKCLIEWTAASQSVQMLMSCWFGAKKLESHAIASVLGHFDVNIIWLWTSLRFSKNAMNDPLKNTTDKAFWQVTFERLADEVKAKAKAVLASFFVLFSWH